MANRKIIIRKGKGFEIAKHLTIWQFNIKTGEVKEAALIQHNDQDGKQVFVLNEEKKMFYLPADGYLNATEAFKKAIADSVHEAWYNRLLDWFYYIYLSIHFKLKKK